MNTMAEGAAQRLVAQIGEALFGQPGLTLMELAEKVKASQPSPTGQGDAPWPEIDMILADAYSAGALGLQFEGIARRAAVRAVVAALAARQPVGQIVGWQHCADNYAHMVISDRNKAALKERETEEGIRKIDAAYSIPLVRQPVGQEPVAYLDLGAGGYMDVGTDLSDEELAALPKGRHMLGIIGTHGVDGYKPAQAVDDLADEIEDAPHSDGECENCGECSVITLCTGCKQPAIAAQAVDLGKLLPAVRNLVVSARTSGGTAGRDAHLCEALDGVEALLPPFEIPAVGNG